MGTLGRQGNPGIVSRIEERLIALKKNYFLILMSEIFPERIKQLSGDVNINDKNTNNNNITNIHDKVDAWIQVACPRLSVDWGLGFHKPVLSSFEGITVLDSLLKKQKTNQIQLEKSNL